MIIRVFGWWQIVCILITPTHHKGNIGDTIGVPHDLQRTFTTINGTIEGNIDIRVELVILVTHLLLRDA